MRVLCKYANGEPGVNTFLNNYYYGARVERQLGAMINGNSFEGESNYTGSRFALYINYLANGFEVTNNIMSGTPTTGWRYGIYALNNDGTVANRGKMNHVIDLSTSASGVYFLKVISDNNTISTQVLVKK